MRVSIALSVPEVRPSNADLGVVDEVFVESASAALFLLRA